MSRTSLGTVLASEIARFLGRSLVGEDFQVRNLSGFPAEQENSLCHLVADAALPEPLARVRQSLVLTSKEQSRALLDCGYSTIESEHPKYDLAVAVNELMVPRPQAGIHGTVSIGPNVSIGQNVTIGPFCLLDGYINIGNSCVLGAQITLKNDVLLENEVRIRNGAVLGEDAYSFGFGPNGESVRFPCVGGLRIGNKVEIGNNVVISRGVHENTVLADGSRVNDLAHIGNSVIVGKNSLVMAQCDISSRVRIGEGCWVGQSAVVRQGIRIADRAMVGAGSVVVKDVPENTVVVGNPAAVIRDRF